jgi:hypothetical protein
MHSVGSSVEVFLRSWFCTYVKEVSKIVASASNIGFAYMHNPITYKRKFK